MKKKIKSEIERIQKFNHYLLNVDQEINISDVDIRDYAKFILKNGEIEEKRKLLEYLIGRIILRDRQIII
jgi:hypothetical protein